MKPFSECSPDKASKYERGVALPAALYLVLIISAVGAMYTRMAIATQGIIEQQRAGTQLFNQAEGAAHNAIRDMISRSNLWLAKTPLSVTPNGYTMYTPQSYSARNGIPPCSGIGCHRNLYPLGGGLVKNVGPIGGVGDTADASLAITDQLNLSSPQTADITLSGSPGWVQVERLDETLPNANAVGGDLANNTPAGSAAHAVRFRITGLSMHSIKGEPGKATVVTVVEVPAS